jgi:hypothetical protein
MLAGELSRSSVSLSVTRPVCGGSAAQTPKPFPVTGRVRHTMSHDVIWQILNWALRCLTWCLAQYIFQIALTNAAKGFS